MAEPAPTLAAYGSASLTEVVPALFGVTERERELLPPAARDATSVVLLAVDGLGASALERHAACLPTIVAMDRAVITSVLPATTAAALTSLTTAAPPTRHGLVGYRVLVGEHVLNALRWQVEGARNNNRAPDVHEVQRVDAFRGRPVPVVTKSEFRKTGFTVAHLGAGPFHGWRTVSALVEHCRRLVAAGERLVYAYYPGVDEVAHEYGLHDGFYEAELRATDGIVAQLLDGLPEECALVVTADHGQVDIAEEAWVDTHALAPLLHLQSGDARFRHLHAKPGAANELAQECERAFGHLAWVRTRRRLIDEEWLGARPVPAVGGRIGDVVLMPFEPVGFIDPALPRERGLRSAHGAPTADEMLVPLLAARGRA
ncbi:MAG TPA: alkaline phosphatase family protein [Acidimicrobiia bacterium]